MRNSYWIFFLLLLASCAQILSPDGGPKDLHPPVVVRYMPDSAAVNFTGKKIILRFDEYVQVSDVQNQLIVSPPLQHQPGVEIRRKEVVITINDTLQPNTTYSLSFGNSIKDITEGNILDNFHYVFSTGPVIDSLHLAGKLINATTLNGEKGVMIMLYNTADDSAPFKRRPYYFTKTNADGSFMITNIRAGSYKLFALDDKTRDYFYNDPEERIAFREQLITMDHNMDTMKLSLFREVPKKQKRIKANLVSRGHISLIYAMPVNELSVPLKLDAEEAKGLLIEHNATNDTIDIWFTKFNHDTLVVPVYDGKRKIDSAAIRIPREGNSQGRTGRGGGVMKPSFACSVTGGATVDPLRTIYFASGTPVKEFDQSLFVLMKGKDTVHTTISSPDRHRILLAAKLDYDSSYKLLVKPGAITDWFGQKNDTLLIPFTTESAEHFSVLRINLTGVPQGNYALQLLNEKDQVIQQMNPGEKTTVTFEHLGPGQYRLKLIADGNGNGKWDTGDYLRKIQPEQVIYYATPIRIRAGWDMDVDWKFQ